MGNEIGNPVPVIDAKFCFAHAMNLLVKLDKGFLKSTIFKVLDANTGEQLLQIVKGGYLVKNKDWLILDASDSILATLRPTTLSGYDVWRVYKGGNTREESLCKVKRQDAHTLNVLIGSNQEKKEKKVDFHVKGFPPIVYMNDNIVAIVNNNFSPGGDQRGNKGDFKVEVNGGIDYVFIVALIIIHREMAKTNRSSSNGNEAIIRGGSHGAIGADGGGGGDASGGGVGGDAGRGGCGGDGSRGGGWLSGGWLGCGWGDGGGGISGGGSSGWGGGSGGDGPGRVKISGCEGGEGGVDDGCGGGVDDGVGVGGGGGGDVSGGSGCDGCDAGTGGGGGDGDAGRGGCGDDGVGGGGWLGSGGGDGGGGTSGGGSSGCEGGGGGTSGGGSSKL